MFLKIPCLVVQSKWSTIHNSSKNINTKGRHENWAYWLTERAGWEIILLKDHGVQTEWSKVYANYQELNVLSAQPNSGNRYFFYHTTLTEPNILGQIWKCLQFMNVLNCTCFMDCSHAGQIALTGTAHLCLHYVSLWDCISRAICWYDEAPGCEREVVLPCTIRLKFL